MTAVPNDLLQLQLTVAASDRDRGYEPFLDITENDGLLDIHYHGNLLLECDGPFDDLLKILSQPDIAPRIRSVRFDGHSDRGRLNGTLPFELDQFLSTSSGYPKLETLEFERGSGVIVGYYDEDGMLANVLRACPSLRRLTTPSAPNAAFFSLASHALTELVVDVGYDHENFILNLSQATCFPDLRRLSYNDYNETYMDDWQSNCTPFEHFLALFESSIIGRFDSLAFNRVTIAKHQINQLLAIRSAGVQFNKTS